MKSQKLRWVLWTCMLAIVGVLAFMDQEPQGTNLVEVAERPNRKALSPVAASNNSTLHWKYLEARTQTSAIEVNLFAPRQLKPTKSATTSPKSPEIILKPSAPPPPFQYLGQLDVESGKVLIFLTDGRRVYSLMPGEVINNVWRLDRDEPQALHFTYLPMDVKQIISKSTKVISTEISQGVTG